MLRALGILFIICSCFFLSLAGAGVVVAFVHFGGIEAIQATFSKHDPPAAEGRRMPESNVPNIQTTSDEDEDGQSNGHNAAVTPIDYRSVSTTLPGTFPAVNATAISHLLCTVTDFGVRSVTTDPAHLKWSGAELEKLVLVPADMQLKFEVDNSKGDPKFDPSLIAHFQTGPAYRADDKVIEGKLLASSTATIGLTPNGQPFRIRAAGTANLVRITNLGNSSYFDAPKVSDEGPFEITTFDGFVRIEFASEATKHYLVVADANGNVMTTEEFRPLELSGEIYRIDLKNLTTINDVKVYIVGEKNNDHSYSPLILVKPSRPTSSVPAPSWKNLELKLKTEVQTAHEGFYYLPKEQFSINLAQTGLPVKDFHVVAQMDGKTVDFDPVSNSAAALDINPPVGPSSFQILLVEGNHVHYTSDPIRVRVLAEGPDLPRPDVTDVILYNGTKIRLQFDSSHPLKPLEKEIPIEVVSDSSIKVPVTYKLNSSTNSIEINLDRVLPIGRYTLKVPTAKIVDHAGHPIPANDDTKQFYQFVFDKISAVDAAPIVAVGIDGVAGDFVEYEEYTRPRQYQTGFNPSDKVVSAVARLYYFRDAHRVAQIINRKAMSYNKQKVDMMQQAADKSRRFANEQTDERLAKEIEAVQAAQLARQSEESLDVLQRSLVQARTQEQDFQQLANRAQDDVNSSQQKLEVLQAKNAASNAAIEQAKESLGSASKELGTTKTEIEQLQDEQFLLEKKKQAHVAKPKDNPDLTAEEERTYAKNGLKLQDLQAKKQALQNAIDAQNKIIAEQQVEQQELTPALAQTNEEIRNKKIAESRIKAELQRAQTQIDLSEQRIRNTLGDVQAKREKELDRTNAWQQAERAELRSREDQFQLEVAAAHGDPGTYAKGNPISDDPVAQVSITVIGEGLIQLRGPRKGVNIVRTMINQIDAPVGQCRITVHTVQINGEHGDRMEVVAHRIQRYIDHSRFLTAQSTQMLRNAVVTVASRRANAICGDYPGLTQADRDIKYLEAFFGADFIAELREMDSEFLHTGNKVLSLNSMDVTSLNSALFLLALAKNDVRQEILQEFMASIETKLPVDEQDYYMASAPDPDCKKCALGLCKGSCKKKGFNMMAQNARFVSFRGFFDAQVVGPDTLNPLQREFIRLAQIFKSRLMTEVEFRQRVMERALIEERTGETFKEYVEQRRQAKIEDDKATQVIRNQQVASIEQQQVLLNEFSKLEAVYRSNYTLDLSVNQLFLNADSRNGLRDALTKRIQQIISQPLSSATPSSLEEAKHQTSLQLLQSVVSSANADTEISLKLIEDASKDGFLISHKINIGKFQEVPIKIYAKPDANFKLKDLNPNTGVSTDLVYFDIDEAELKKSYSVTKSDLKLLWRREFDQAYEEIKNYLQLLSDLQLRPADMAIAEDERKYFVQIDTVASDERATSLRNAFILSIIIDKLRPVQMQLRETADGFVNEAKEIALLLGDDRYTFQHVFNRWNTLRAKVIEVHVRGKPLVWIKNLLQPIDDGFMKLLAAVGGVRSAQAIANNNRRSLDHKKFLDMLIDDTEEKFIELVEGTRAHTANVDNYIQRICTALEDDLNTQFYYPAFRYIRETSQYYDVQVGQVQTESILTNNREFAKVSPQATMEFDLPKRDIVIKEAFDAALASYNDFGGLVTDPNFLALAQMYSGQPTSSAFNNAPPAPMVRDVLPGLPSTSDERFLVQQPVNQPQFASQLSALIPDPAVYKFETGTGFEIRPVIQPDGQAVVFHLNYLYSTNIREPIRADEKHLGRVKRHFIDTDVQLANYELREVSRFQVALKASRTSRGVPLLEDAPGLGFLFRPLPSDESSLQQNLILSQATIYPTLFDLMGLRWATAVADLDSLNLREHEFVTSNRELFLRNEVFDYSSQQVDEYMRIPPGERRADTYRSQQTIPQIHPNGYNGPGLNIYNSPLREEHRPSPPAEPYIPNSSLPSGVTQPPLYIPAEPVLVPEPLGFNPTQPATNGSTRASASPSQFSGSVNSGSPVRRQFDANLQNVSYETTPNPTRVRPSASPSPQPSQKVNPAPQSPSSTETKSTSSRFRILNTFHR